MNSKEQKTKISDTIQAFNKGNHSDNALQLFKTLGYESSLKSPLATPSYQVFKERFVGSSTIFREDKSLSDQWLYIDVLFQLTKDEIIGMQNLFTDDRIDDKIMDSYLFFFIELSGESYSRTILSQITREVNKLFPMPAMIIFKHGTTLTFAIIDRRLHKRDAQKDVLEKVFLIKDINTTNPHRAHIEILADLSLSELLNKYTINNFIDLHNAWAKTLDTKELNKRFYHELSNWYFWAMDKVTFPDDIEENEEIRNATALIRLITRIIFIWFIKEKELVPDNLFNPKDLKTILKDFNTQKTSSSYYRAILQNLFFGTLNQKMGERKFVEEGDFKVNRKEYGVKTLFRYANLFSITEDEALALFKDIPFLNGGLFDCLDKPDDNDKIQYIDGFSRKKQKQSNVPDYLFFTEKAEADLNSFYGTSNKKYEVKGLIEILSGYKFTVTENTPIEEEVALDPELLGKVFENLLASFNPETKTTARKQTGSFYTPREIVNYMVDESLIAYFNQNIEDAGQKAREEDLRELLSYTEEPNPFSGQETKLLINSIDTCKILDPACGSGAFPMGILHKLVHILHKLDPDNSLWKERQVENAYNIEDISIRDKLLEDIEEAFEQNELDYGRKLYLIENCIYGIDIQPIAVQIAKLRFFISLIIDQKKQPDKENLGIQALPNLETKFVAANTLIGLEKPEGYVIIKDNDGSEKTGTQMTLCDNEIVELSKELKSIRHRYFNAKTRRDKLRYQRQDRDIRERMAELLKKDHWDKTAVEQIVAFDPYDQNASSPFFDMEWMFGITGGFDIVIGNPPYVSHDKILEKRQLKRQYSAFDPFADIYCFFIEKGIKLQNKQGIMSYITSNSYLRSEYGQPIRKYIINNNNLLSIINIDNSQVFESAIVNVAIIISIKDSNIEKCAVVNSSYSESVKFATFINNNKYYYEQNMFNANVWNLIKPDHVYIQKKIESKGITLEKLNAKIRLGLATGYNSAFIISEGKRQELINKDPKNKEIIKPIIRGRDILRYSIIKPGLYILLTKNGVNVPNDYPDIYEYFKQFGNKFKKRGAKGQHWTNLRACAFFDDFKKEKIIWIELANTGRFALCTEEIYLLNSAYFLLPPKGIEAKYLLGIFNSKLIRYYLNIIAETSGMGTSRWINNYVKKFPIPLVSENEQNKIISKVDDIIKIKYNNPDSDTSMIEKEIDKLVYQLYELDNDDIKHLDDLVENIK